MWHFGLPEKPIGSNAVVSMDPLVFAEPPDQAMACGLPVLATRCGGPEEIITSGRDGLLSPGASSRSIADAVLALAGDADLRDRLGRAARATVVERFSLEVMLDAYRAIYSRLLAD